MITLHQALDIFSKIKFRTPVEEVPLTDSFHRILGEDIYSDVNIPPFDKSAMDGYACRSEDLKHKMRLLGTLHAGSDEKFIVTPGTCVKIMTGAPVPEGADTVVKIEDTNTDKEGFVQFVKSSTKSNICLLGEDIKKGDQVLKMGMQLLPHHVAVLASAGIASVKVSTQPKISILSTGSELVEPKKYPDKAQIRNSNAYSILAQLQSIKIQGDYAGIVPDDKSTIKQLVNKLIKENDILIITGGASVGEHDFVPSVLRELNLGSKFDKLAIQPGKPCSFAAGKNKFCFGLSGNPVSALLQFETLVKPFIFHVMNHEYSPKVVLAELATGMQRKNADRLKFFPVRFNSAGQAEEIKFNGSAHISGLNDADGFGLFPGKCEVLNADEKIEILLIQ